MSPKRELDHLSEIRLLKVEVLWPQDGMCSGCGQASGGRRHKAKIAQSRQTLFKEWEGPAGNFPRKSGGGPKNGGQKKIGQKNLTNSRPSAGPRGGPPQCLPICLRKCGWEGGGCFGQENVPEIKFIPPLLNTARGWPRVGTGRGIGKPGKQQERGETTAAPCGRSGTEPHRSPTLTEFGFLGGRR